MNVKRLVAAAVLVTALAGIWIWWTSDRRRLNARLDEIESLFEKSGPEDQLTSFGRTRQIVAMFAPGFVASARPYEGAITDSQQLAAIVMRYRDGSERIEIGDREREVAIDSPRGTAETTAVFAVKGSRGGGPGGETFRARIAWMRTDGVWKVQEFEVLEVLEGSLLGF
ncbi:MAG: hypothetical protein F9K18_05670 [Thermoanaerobaculia bacterium]|nr:MAG: hypothetical protein F9K18_05670 [Thermoanaerobaculia bacterium]